MLILTFVTCFLNQEVSGPGLHYPVILWAATEEENHENASGFDVRCKSFNNRTGACFWLAWMHRRSSDSADNGGLPGTSTGAAWGQKVELLT